MPNQHITVFVCRLLLAGALLAATTVQGQQRRPYWSNELGNLAYTPEAPGWYRFKPGAVKDGARFFERHKQAFGLGPADSMRLTRSHKDMGGRMHYRFQQYHKGIPVEGAEFLVHEKDGTATSGNGQWVAGWNHSAKAALSEEKALSSALNALPASAYLDGAGSRRSLPRKAYRPKATLVYQKANADLPHTPENLRLCYRFDLYSAAGDGYAVYIDAGNGSLVNKLPLQSACVPATAATNWYGARSISTKAHAAGYYLQDDCGTAQVSVYNNANSTGYGGMLYSQATNNNWNATPDLQSAATSLWACRQTIDFFQSVFKRNGYDNAGSGIQVYQNAGFSTVQGIGYSNASMTFNGGLMKVGNNGTAAASDDWNTLDIIAHEFTHAVTGATSQLAYQGESGALNESFSDIMGVYAEFWEGSTTADWLLGEERGSAFRSLQNPGQFGHPSTYKSPVNWYTGTADNGGVHINSGVQNYWFYLLANGGSGTNDNGKAYSVKGIGLADAGFIAYMTHAFYLTAGAQYLDARNQSIQAAIDYYGGCSVAALETAKAWYAVGVGGAQTLAGDRNLCGSFTASTQALKFQGVDLLPVAKGCTTTFFAAPNPYLLSASKTVVLYPGFTALEGSTVNVFIDSCNITLNTYAQVAAKTSEKVAVLPEPALVQPLLPAVVQAYPNPAKQQTTLSLQVSKQVAHSAIALYDLTGRRVYHKLPGTLQPGRHQVQLQLSPLPAGIYMVVVQLDEQQLHTKLVVVK